VQVNVIQRPDHWQGKRILIEGLDLVPLQRDADDVLGVQHDA